MEPVGWTCPFFTNLIVMWVVTPLVILWELVWKGIALWKAGRNGHLVWFILILILNTPGILPIIYIFGFSKPNK